MMNFENIKILQKPKGKVIFVACDSIYFDKFSDKLATSFIAHVKNFNCLHFHIISPTEDVLEKMLHSQSTLVTFSFEDSTCIRKINRKIPGRFGWLAALPKKIKSMLVAEQERNNKIRGFVISKFLRLHFSENLFLRRKWLDDSKSKVYYACRRFMMPISFFDEISSVLIVDVDSYFNADVMVDVDMSSIGAFAICRNKSWSKFLAGFVYVKTNQHGVLFLNKMRNDLIKHFSDGCIYWGVDQVLLDRCGEAGLLSCFSNIDVGFEKNSSASFISLKGNLKWLS